MRLTTLASMPKPAAYVNARPSTVPRSIWRGCQRSALHDLERTRRYVSEDLEVYFDDIIDASERIWDMLENFKEVVEGLESTNESVLSHRVNDVLKALTAISVVVLPLTLVASIWGMNVGVPGEGSIHAFWIVVGAMAALLGGMLWFFRRRGWL